MGKRIVTVLALVLSLLFLTSCQGGCIHNTVKENQGSIHFSLDGSYAQYMDYATIPDYTLSFAGTLNTSTAIEDANMAAFAGNDDFVVSDLIASLLAPYEGTDRYKVTSVNVDTGVYLTKMNVLTDKGTQKQIELVPSDNTIHEEIAYLQLSNGLILSVEYRRFTSYQDKSLATTTTLHTYYAWRYADLLNMVLHYPLMVVEETNGRALWIVPLPLGVTYDIGATEHTSAATIIKKDKYVADGAYTYPYPGFNDDPSQEVTITHDEQVALVRTYYLTYCAGESRGDTISMSYLGKNFSVSFGADEFTIRPVLAN